MERNNLSLLVERLNQPPIMSSVAVESRLITQDGQLLMTQAGEQLVAQMQINTSATRIHPYGRIKRHLDRFLGDVPHSRWLLMPGLRGVGKTTILKQLYHDIKLRSGKFYLSFDQVKILDPDYRTTDVIAALEESLQSKLEDYPEPLVVFFDEVQYMPDWALGLKTVFDRCRRVFILATGSSALALQTNPDVARRVDIIKAYPLSLADFVNLSQVYGHEKSSPNAENLAQNLRTAIFGSADIGSLAAALRDLRPAVDSYWQSLNRSYLLRQYRQYGSLPYTLTAASEGEMARRVNQTLDTILLKDIATESRSSSRILAMMPKLMILLAHAEKRGLAVLAKILGVSLDTVQDMINQLERAEIIEAVRPWGAKSGHLTKPYRYLFASPALRLALLDSGGQIDIDSQLRDRARGLLWEDAVGLSLRRILESERAAIEYDTAPGAADFIVSWGDRPAPIIVEVGSHKTSDRQIELTKRLTESRYGLIVTDCDLKIDERRKVVYLPFSFFLLA